MKGNICDRFVVAMGGRFRIVLLCEVTKEEHATSEVGVSLLFTQLKTDEDSRQITIFLLTITILLPKFSSCTMPIFEQFCLTTEHKMWWITDYTSLQRSKSFVL